jgi:hypothetical protein
VLYVGRRCGGSFDAAYYIYYCTSFTTSLVYLLLYAGVGGALTLPQVFEAAPAALSRPVSGLAAGKLVVQLVVKLVVKLLVNLVVKLAAAASLSRAACGLVAGKLRLG